MEAAITGNRHFSASRLNSLYLDFERLRELNPEGFEANVTAWGSLLRELLRAGRLGGAVAFGSAALPQALALPVYGAPRALAAALTELVRRGDLVPLLRYRALRRPYQQVLAGPSWRDYVSPRAWLAWGVERVRGDFEAGDRKGALVDEYYIDWRLLCEVGAAVEARRGGRAFDLEAFAEWVAPVVEAVAGAATPALTPIDIDILVLHLTRDRGVAAYDRGCLKLGGPVEDHDVAEVRLTRAIASAEQRQRHLDASVSRVDAQLRQLVAQPAQRQRAHRLLQTKRVFEASSARVAASLAQLQRVLGSLGDAADNRQMVEAMQQLTQALQALNRKADQRQVDELLEEVEQSVQRTEEILAQLAGMDVDVDVEEELERMEGEARQAREAREAREARQAEGAVKAVEATADDADDAMVARLARLRLDEAESKAPAEPQPSESRARKLEAA